MHNCFTNPNFGWRKSQVNVMEQPNMCNGFRCSRAIFYSGNSCACSTNNRWRICQIFDLLHYLCLCVCVRVFVCAISVSMTGCLRCTIAIHRFIYVLILTLMQKCDGPRCCFTLKWFFFIWFVINGNHCRNTTLHWSFISWPHLLKLKCSYCYSMGGNVWAAQKINYGIEWSGLLS